MAFLVTCSKCKTEYLDSSKFCPNCASGAVSSSDDKAENVNLSSPNSHSGEVGFFRSLFDFKFETYVTRRVASVMYAILTVIVLLATVILFILSIVSLGNPYAGGESILLVILTPILGLLLLTTIRLGFETSIALVAIAENTKK
jgi:ABC-type multidrug transport system permease subunit